MKLWVWVLLAMVTGGVIGYYMGKKKVTASITTTTPAV